MQQLMTQLQLNRLADSAACDVCYRPDSPARCAGALVMHALSTHAGALIMHS